MRSSKPITNYPNAYSCKTCARCRVFRIFYFLLLFLILFRRSLAANVLLPNFVASFPRLAGCKSSRTYTYYAVTSCASVFEAWALGCSQTSCCTTPSCPQSYPEVADLFQSICYHLMLSYGATNPPGSQPSEPRRGTMILALAVISPLY